MKIILSNCKIFSLVCLLIIQNFVHAQSEKSVRSIRTDSYIKIDGNLDEEDWLQVTPIANFTQFAPNSGISPTNQTEVRILFGKDNFYLGVTLFDDPEMLAKTLGRRDEFNHADWFIVSIDSYFNRKVAYTFGVNIGGIQLDGLLNKPLQADGSLISGLDLSWNAVWTSSTKITNDGWVAEIRIPYSMLRYSVASSQTWGIHFFRRTARLGEDSEWPYIPHSERTNLVSQFGQISDIEIQKSKTEFQLRPYVLSKLQSFENINKPGEGSYEYSFNAGGDIKLGFGSNLIMDVTINPDFGQVEADPAVLNLTAFETRFLENRPFFMEAADVFKFGIGQSQLFHSRRIGAKGPILGATKISGRSAQGLSFGILGAATGNHLHASSNYGVSRINQQFGRFSSTGAILTYYQSPLHYGDGWKSYTAGVDWDLRFANNNYSFEGITALANRSSLLPERSNEKGYMGGIVFRKRSGKFFGHLTFLVFSDQYNPNDLGWTTMERDFRNVWINTTYNINDGKSFGPFQRASITTYNTQRLSYVDWLNIGDINSITAEFITNKYQTLKFSSRFTDMFGGYDLFETRGLGHWARPSNIKFTGQFITDQRRSWKMSQEGEFTTFNNEGKLYTIKVDTRLDFGTKISFSGIAGFNYEHDVLAWVANESFLYTSDSWHIGINSVPPDLLKPTDFVQFEGNGILESILREIAPLAQNIYYVPVFGNRSSKLVDLSIRGTFTFFKNMSLQVYNQLLIAQGKYDNFQILQNPDKFATFESYPKKSDFNLNSFNLNMVLRWEYRAGSTFYLIWSQARNEKGYIYPVALWETSSYPIKFNDQIKNTFNIFPQNTLIVKLNYTILNR